MSKEILDFEQWCQDSWGVPIRSHKEFAFGAPRIMDHVEFGKSSAALKMHIAEKLILESCSHLGAFFDSGDVTWYLHGFARELQGTARGFRGRRLQPLKAALLLTSLSEFSSALPFDRSDFEHIKAGGGAMSAMYLLAHLEFLCRIKSRYLTRAGKVHQEIPQQLRKKAGINDRKQVNQIHQAFILYLYRNRTPLAKRLHKLERALGIVDRLKKIRNPVMHGELADPSVEAYFLGLLIAMFYFSEKAGAG